MKLSRLSGRPFQKPTFTSIHLSIVIWNTYELNTFSGRKDNPDIKAYISPRLLSGLVNFIQDYPILTVIKIHGLIITVSKYIRKGLVRPHVRGNFISDIFVVKFISEFFREMHGTHILRIPARIQSFVKTSQYQCRAGDRSQMLSSL